MKEDFDRCTFVTAKDDGAHSVCRDKLYCGICQYCHKHCIEHAGVKKVILDLAQNKKAL